MTSPDAPSEVLASVDPALRVVIVEDHALVRTGLRTTLLGAGMHVVGEASDGIAAEFVIDQHRPDVAIIDLGLPGRDGVQLTRLLRERSPSPRIVILTMQDSEEHVFAALAAGADCYCVKSSSDGVIIDAVRTASRGGAYFDQAIAQFVLRRIATPNEVGASPLTERETDVLRLIAEGVGNNEIAEQLFLGVGTVKGHIAQILRKLEASDRANAAITAYRRGYLR